MALESIHPTSILLSGPPASAKTLFLQCLMKLNDSYFIDCSNATKSGLVDYIFDHKPKYLLLDELDMLSRKDQAFLLNLIETGIVSETKYGKTRSMKIKTFVFATSNTTSNQYNIDEEITKATAYAVWNTTQNIRDCVRVANTAKSVEDVYWLVNEFLTE
jgi:holliday junction DNA helicase RuvB